MKRDWDEKAEKWEPTSKDMTDLETELKKFPQREVRGKLISPFDLYLKDQGVIRYDMNMVVWVKNPSEHERLSRINGRLEYRQTMQQERLFDQFPEERRILHDKIFGLKDKITAKPSCTVCHCLLVRSYVCRHECETCLSSNPVTA